MIWHTNRKLITRQEPPLDPYLRSAYDFLKMWNGGKQAFTLQTSGSTGQPKTIEVSRNQLASSAHMTGKALGLKVGTRALVCLNVTYVAGLMMLVRGMELDWELTVIEPIANPLAGLENMEFDFVAMVPLQFTECLNNPDTSVLIQNVGTILLGGAPVSAALQQRIQRLEKPVFQSYGMTETVSHVALRPLNGHAESDYEILPGIHFGTDSRGCLFVSGAVTNGEIVQTNDLIEITGESTFKWVGRADHVVNSGGIKIIPDRIDKIVAAVFSSLTIDYLFFVWHQNDDLLGQKLILIVEGREDQNFAKTVLAEIRKRVPAYETPKHVYFADQFLRTATDKIDKRGTAEKLLRLLNG